MKKLRWGILSTARIAVTKVIPALQRSRHGQVVAIASRDLAMAKHFATALDIPQYRGSYKAVLEDPHVDAVYIPLPNHLHVPWAMRALHAGKHVLCEKPIGLDADDVKALVEMSAKWPRLKVAEAFMYRHHPQWSQVIHLIKAGRIGQVRSVDVHFSYFNSDPKNIRNQAALGGGALMDIGCYGISVARWVFGERPIKVAAAMHHHPDFGTDILTFARIDFPSGSATITCGTQLYRFQQVTILGTLGYIRIPVPFNIGPDESTTLQCRSNADLFDLTIRPADQFARQGDHFAQAIWKNRPLKTTLYEAWENMQTLDSCVAEADARPMPPTVTG